MRDQWRAEDLYKDSDRPRERGTDRRRDLSPAAPRRERDTEGGLKIKGRAVAESAPGYPSRSKNVHSRGEPERNIRRRSSRSPQGRRPIDEQRSKRPRESSRERDSERHRRRHESDYSHKRRRTRSRSAEPGISDFREERRRHRSPVYSGRTDSFRPRSRSRSRSRSRYRERLPSPQRPARGDHYSSYHLEASGTSRFADSYVPGSHRRLSPPAYKESLTRRRSPSSDRHIRVRKGSSPRRRLASPDRYSRKDREPRVSIHRSPPRRRDTSRRREEPKKHRRNSPQSSRTGSRGHTGRQRSSRSPVPRKEARESRTKMQQSPTRPIQSVLNEESRPLSQLNRIPSFDAAQNQSANINNAFPMHGMKAGEVHGVHRQARPPHLNTQHSYSTSPQWTPTSSHHGSPHTGSPYSQGRGGWNGQSHHYQSQSG